MNTKELGSDVLNLGGRKKMGRENYTDFQGDDTLTRQEVRQILKAYAIGTSLEGVIIDDTDSQQE